MWYFDVLVIEIHNTIFLLCSGGKVCGGGGGGGIVKEVGIHF